MNINYEHEGNSNYLTIELSEDIKTSYQFKMFEKNQISGFLNMSIRTVNNIISCYYNITSYQQLTSIYRVNRISWEEIIIICESIEQILVSAENYLLDLDSVVINPEYMYMNRTNKDIKYIYNPMQTQKFEQGIKELFDYILENFDHNEDRRKTMQLYQLYQNIMDGNMDCKNIADKLKDTQAEAECFDECINDADIAAGSSVSVEIPAITAEKIEEETEEIPQKRICIIKGLGLGFAAAALFFAAAIIFPQKMPFKINLLLAGGGFAVFSGLAAITLKYQKKLAEYGVVETKNNMQPYYAQFKEEQEQENIDSQETYNDTSQNTVLLSEYIKNNKKTETIALIALDNADKSIYISDFPCVIGSNSEFSSVCIHNSVVSKCHLCISKEGEEYCIEDMNATNGTFLNGERMKPQSRQNLHVGDVLGIANLFYKVEKS